MLLDAGADANAQVGDYDDALQAASAGGHKTVVNMLLDAGANVNARGYYAGGRTPLLWAAEKGHKVVVDLLLRIPDVDLNARDNDGQTALSRAAENGHNAVVDLLLRIPNVDLNARDNDGQTALSRAAENGYEAVVDLLLRIPNVDLNSRDNDGRTALSWAAENGHEAVVYLLLRTHDVDLNSKDDKYGRTPLSWAAGEGHEAVVRLLFEMCDDFNPRDNDNRTALSRAAENGHEAVVDLLLRIPNVDLYSRDSDGRTALSWAAEKGHKVVVHLLLRMAGLNLNPRDNYGRTALSWAAENGHEAVVDLLLRILNADLNSKDNDGRTALSRAAEHGHEAVIGLLLRIPDVDLNSRDNDGRTALSRAAENGHEVVVHLLLRMAGLNLNPRDNYGRTALSRAAENGHKAVVDLLLLRIPDVDLNSRDNDGQTALSRAAEHGHEAVIGLLLRIPDVDLNSRDNDGRTALSRAAENGHEAVVDLLLRIPDVNLNSRDNDGRTALSWAAENGHEAVVDLLLRILNADLNSKDNKYGRTPLSWAAGEGHEAVVLLLLAKGEVDLNSKDGSGLTPLLWASKNGHKTVVKLLLDKDDVDPDATDIHGNTARSLAEANRHKAVAELLLAKDGVQPDSGDKDSGMLLKWATKYKDKILEADRILEAVERAKAFHVCPYSVWAIARSIEKQENLSPPLDPVNGKQILVQGHGEGDESILPKLIPSTDQQYLVTSHDGGFGKHDHCTFDFCEYSRIDYTYMEQRHECLNKDCAGLRSFPPEILKQAAISGHLTAWKLNGESMVDPPEPFMAISHVWADGTGAGERPAGLVNKCLYDFFCSIAKHFKCEGIWWDTICIPVDKEARINALNQMQTNYADARITLVHDQYLRNWKWVSAEHACFAIVMSPWFTRGWTALELAESRKVKVLFQSKSRGVVIKDLDSILEEANDTVPAMAIRKLRKKSVTTVNDILAALRPRVTAKPKDMAIISALLAGVHVPGNLRQQEIYQRILKKIGNICDGNLFHNAATMSEGFSWCPTSLLDMPLAQYPREALKIEKNGDVVGWWKVIALPDKDPWLDYIWVNTQPLIKVKLQGVLGTRKRDEHLLLVEKAADKITRALLVKIMQREKQTQTTLCCQPVGPVYFREPLPEATRKLEMMVTIGDMREMADIDIGAWKFAEEVQKVQSAVTTAIEEGGVAKPEDDLKRNEQTSDPNVIFPMESTELLSMMLLSAAEKGDQTVVRLLLQNRANGHARDSKGRTALILATMNEDVKIVELLLQHRVKPDAQDSKGRTALILAAMNGDDKIAKLLLSTESNAANPDIEDNYRWTALHYAVWRRDKTVVMTLLDHRASPFVSDDLGQSPIHLGAERGDKDIVVALFKKYTESEEDRASDLVLPCKDGQTVLHRAAWGGCQHTVSFLVEKGAMPKSASSADNEGKTALHLAAENGYPHIVKYLLQMRPGLEIVEDGAGQKALSLADSRGHDDVCLVIDPEYHKRKFGVT
jgi:ankyrin repeat protein